MPRPGSDHAGLRIDLNWGRGVVTLGSGVGPKPGPDAAAALLHAVASSAEASGIASLTGSGILASSEWIIFIVSSRATTGAALGHAALAPLSSCLMT